MRDSGSSNTEERMKKERERKRRIFRASMTGATRGSGREMKRERSRREREERKGEGRGRGKLDRVGCRERTRSGSRERAADIVSGCESFITERELSGLSGSSLEFLM